MSAADDLEAQEAWQARACADLTPWEADRVFFTAGGRNEAYRLCQGCPALDPCGRRALAIDRLGDYDPYGVVAAMTPDQRAATIRAEQSRTLAS